MAEGLVGGRSRWRHKPSGVIGLVYSRQSTFTGRTVTLECLSDPRKAEHPERMPFATYTTSTLQPCCPLQGAMDGYVGGPCPVHGKPFYLEHFSTQPLTIPVDQFNEEWERTDA